MNKTVGVKAKNRRSKRKMPDVAKPTLASLLAQQTPEKKAATKAYVYEILGKDEEYFKIYENVEANRAEIIERHKITWEAVKAAQEAWKELGIPDDVVFKSNPDL